MDWWGALREYLKDKFWARVGLGIALVALTISIWLWKRRQDRLAFLRNQWNRQGKDVVILHQFPRARFCPSPSPFPLKLETYLRMTDIKYVNDFEEYMSDKQKCPWITINGKDVADSQLAIDYLNHHFDCSPSKVYKDCDRALGQAFRIMLEEHFYWGFVLDRWIYEKGHHAVSKFEPLPIPESITRLLFQFAGRKLSTQAKAQGMGRHAKEDVENLCLGDLKAISDFLGEKPFLLGDNPTELETYLRMADIKYVNDFEEYMSAKQKCPWITINGKDVADSQLAINYLNHHFDCSPSKNFSDREQAMLETYLRMADIKYVNDFEEYMSAKQKCPWITINGKDVADSQLAINYLNHHFDCSPSKNFSDREQAMVRAFRIISNSASDAPSDSAHDSSHNGANTRENGRSNGRSSKCTTISSSPSAAKRSHSFYRVAASLFLDITANGHTRLSRVD
eukprot:snap_masked-scaffold13_size735724-processed-gene-2.14 protein:Tk03458 transcript:snap_masked-scaffold13_size735724-processed-gene-2.14-mRNA-1 annotation:"gst-n-metaxin-like protein"